MNPLYKYAAALAAFISILGVAYYKGIEHCQSQQKTEVIKGVETRDRIETEVIRLSDPDLDARLARWMRD